MKLVIDNAIFQYQHFFGSFGQITAVNGRDINNAMLADADVLIVRSRTQVNQTLLTQTPVRFVGSGVSGLDHIDTHYLQQSNISFASAPGCNANAVAEYVIAALVNLANDTGFDLAHKSLGIIGVGNVGSALKNKARALGMTTYLNDPPRAQFDKSEHFCDIKTALSADIISVHTPLILSGKFPTYHLINQHALTMLDGKVLINTARGGVIDESVWQHANTRANIIDCWQTEPHINRTLHTNAYLATPHIAGHSIDAKAQGSFCIYQALCRYLNITPTIAINQFIKPPPKHFTNANLAAVINHIYDFRRDERAIEDISAFEPYRRLYPERYEWHHYHHPTLNGLTQRA